MVGERAVGRSLLTGRWTGLGSQEQWQWGIPCTNGSGVEGVDIGIGSALDLYISVIAGVGRWSIDPFNRKMAH